MFYDVAFAFATTSHFSCPVMLTGQRSGRSPFRMLLLSFPWVVIDLSVGKRSQLLSQGLVHLVFHCTALPCFGATEFLHT